MFTGIVEFRGQLVSTSETGGGRLLVVDTGPLAEGLEVGDSVAVNGTCLTVTGVEGSHAVFEAVSETLRRTNLGSVEAGDPVNLERPIPANGRFDGHLVQGHVDGMGTVRAVEAEGDSRRVWIEVAPELLRYVTEKGSVTIDGVSLTVSGLDDTGFEVILIPHTLAVTTLGARHVGDRVNIEVDVLAKYVERLLETSR